jgi:dihydrofolate reductase
VFSKEEVRDGRPIRRDQPEEKGTATMKLTTNTNVSVDGVMQGLGGAEEDRRGGFDRGGWAMPHFDSETADLTGQVTHHPAETIVKKGGTSYIFVTDGIEAALDRARQAAGPQDVRVNGGAEVARQFLNAGLQDEIRLHLVPIILGAGTRLFEGVRTDVRLVPREAQNAPAVTHLIYDVERPTAEL